MLNYDSIQFLFDSILIHLEILQLHELNSNIAFHLNEIYSDVLEYNGLQVVHGSNHVPISEVTEVRTSPTSFSKWMFLPLARSESSLSAIPG